MDNKKGFSILKAVISVIAIILIIVSLGVNIAFSGGKTPHLFGKYIYIADDNELGDNVTQGAALIAADAADVEIAEGDIVVCYPEGSSVLQLRSIFKISTDETTGAAAYYTATATEQGTELSIGKDRIVAICTGNPESLELGKYISFTTNIKGIILQLILPCIILVIFLICKIASSKDDEGEKDYDFYEYDEDDDENEGAPLSHAKPAAPLFEPSQEIQPSNELERKKMSIAENFSQKHVNPDSPYQKEKERTMQFKAQRENTSPLSYNNQRPVETAPQYKPAHSAESSFAARNVGGQSSTAPTADALREEMLRKTAEAERTGSFSTKLYGASAQQPTETVSDNTGILSKAQLAEMARYDVPKTSPLKKPALAAAPKKSTSPDIDDIITKSETEAKKRSASDMSVDDLLKMIENEKKKL